MGIRGLLKYIRSDHSKIKPESTVLFKRCGGERLILVCDLIAVFYWLIELLHKAKVTSKDYSQYTCIYGGNFKDYKARILEFVKALRFINVEPVFFGMDLKVLALIMNTSWILGSTRVKSYFEKLERIQKYVNFML